MSGHADRSSQKPGSFIRSEDHFPHHASSSPPSKGGIFSKFSKESKLSKESNRSKASSVSEGPQRSRTVSRELEHVALQPQATPSEVTRSRELPPTPPTRPSALVDPRDEAQLKGTPLRMPGWPSNSATPSSPWAGDPYLFPSNCVLP